MTQEKQLTEIWITKYALSTGVEKRMAKVSNGTAIIHPSKSGYGSEYYHGNEWHLTESDANKRVIEMIASKRISIKKQLAKLDKLEAKIKIHENI